MWQQQQEEPGIGVCIQPLLLSKHDDSNNNDENKNHDNNYNNNQQRRDVLAGIDGASVS
jgi:hypothetical protein